MMISHLIERFFFARKIAIVIASNTMNDLPSSTFALTVLFLGGCFEGIRFPAMTCLRLKAMGETQTKPFTVFDCW